VKRDASYVTSGYRPLRFSSFTDLISSPRRKSHSRFGRASQRDRSMQMGHSDWRIEAAATRLRHAKRPLGRQKFPIRRATSVGDAEHPERPARVCVGSILLGRPPLTIQKCVAGLSAGPGSNDLLKEIGFIPFLLQILYLLFRIFCFLARSNRSGVMGNDKGLEASSLHFLLCRCLLAGV
jgi:hypothetical protein